MNENTNREMTLDELAQLTQEKPNNYYVCNLETGKLELHFEKSVYAALSDAQKASIKSTFLWGRNSGCWISRAKEPHLYHAEQVAKSLGLADAGRTGERISFGDQMQRKQERAEARADRYEARAANAAARGEALQKPINDMHGDIAFFTQPNINSSAGRAFTRRRERMFAAFERGSDEFRKSEYWQGRAAEARKTADGRGMNDPAFLVRRIRECESGVRKIKKAIEANDEVLRKIENGTPPKRFNGETITLEDVERWNENAIDRLEVELDKLGFYQERLEAIGGVQFSADSIKPGYIVRLERWGDCRVVSTGPKNFTYQTKLDGVALTGSYAEIVAIVKAQEAKPARHPFKVGDTFSCSRWNAQERKAEKLEYRIIRATDKSVTLQTGDEKPFVRKPSQIAWDRSGKWRLCITDWNDGIVYKLPEA